MQQHPVPQNVMSVEFQLIGNMTIKQFAYIAAGGILAFLFFSTPLPDFLKWPLVLGTFGLGAAFAFAPINDITLDRWIINFISAVYSPTKRVWRKEAKRLEFLEAGFSKYLEIQNKGFSVTPKNRTKLTEFLSTLKPIEHRTQVDAQEEGFVNALDFGIQMPTLVSTTPAPAISHPPVVIPATTEETRAVEEKPQTSPQPDRLASNVSFRPIMTVRLPDRSIFVKPVSNVRIRSLHALPALEGTIILPVRGEKVFTVSDTLKKRLSEKIHSIRLSLPVMNQDTKPEAPNIPTPAPTPPAPVQPVAPPVPPVVTAPQAPVPPPVATPTPPVKPPAPISVPVPPTLSPETSTPQTPLHPIADMKEVAPVPKPTQYRTEVLNPVPPKPVSREDEFNKQAAAEIAKIKQQLTTELSSTIDNFKRVAAENRRLTQEMSQIKQSQTQNSLATRAELDKIVNEYKSQIEKLRIERETLFGQLGSLQTQSKEYQQKAASSEHLADELNELKNKLDALEQEKTEAEKHSDVLKESLSELQTQIKSQVDQINQSLPAQEPVPMTPVAPQVKIVEAKKAEGKMAPQITTIPNVINGIVKDKNGLLLPEVVIVVKDEKDTPARALKTNKIGQFAISTPLPNGTYLIESEKDGFEFDIISIKLQGELLSPIEIQAK